HSLTGFLGSTPRRVHPARRAVGAVEGLRLLVGRSVGDVLPILENSTACTIVNANYLVQVVFGWSGWDFFGLIWMSVDILQSD
ncbi:MAG: hypothetical protein LC729_04585, partial [Acidobacteria bacterium]|nr:hypothetical protein [Acidobacteriota bacterium]